MLQKGICKLRELIVVLVEQCSRHGIAFPEDALDLRVDQGCHCWTLFTYCGRTRGKGIAASCFLIAIEHEATISAGNPLGCVDVDGRVGSVVMDLNFDEVPAAHKGKYGLVTNHGT